ncbi:MAG: hypothetical protein GY866_18945, partial [Proteobacteria bacterium]|nr:hypothetical protein [Pseudomonadota bacterium]
MQASNCFLVRKTDSTSFFFRSIIPKDIQPLLGQRQFLISLRTGLLKDAKKMARRLYVASQDIYDDIRRNRTPMKKATIEDIKTLLREMLHQYQHPDPEYKQRMRSIFTQEELDLHKKDLAASMEYQKSAQSLVDDPWYQDFGQEYLKLKGFECDKESDEFYWFCIGHK